MRRAWFVVAVFALVSACGRIDFGAGSDSTGSALAGCADGDREAFADVVAFPNVAGCAATWSGQLSMRTPATGVACGNALGPCAAPADACAIGWHVCGASGSLDEIVAIGPAACMAAGPGQFAAAVSHCPTQNFGTCDPTVGDALPCLPMGWCGEPVCCGDDCGLPMCLDGVFPGMTRVAGMSGSISQGCADLISADTTGVLCCR